MEAGGKTVSFDLGRPGDGSYQTDQIASIAKRHPGLKIVLCHMGQPSRAAERNPELWSAWLEQIRLGTLPNVWFDLSDVYKRQAVYRQRRVRIRSSSPM